MKSAAELPLAEKIARLVAERGWTQDEFARKAGLNRHTARKILLRQGPCKLHNATIQACAVALGLPVADLRDLSLARLLPRSSDRYRFESATQPELARWMEDHPERAARLRLVDVEDLLSLQGTGGPLTREGVEHFVAHIERRQKLVAMVETLAGTEYLDLLEQFIGLLHEKVQPYPDEDRSHGPPS